MDPTQTLIDILELLRDMKDNDENAQEDVIESLDHLSTWLKQGGFAPDVEAAISFALKDLRRS